jgi:hypothetical protein
MSFNPGKFQLPLGPKRGALQTPENSSFRWAKNGEHFKNRWGSSRRWMKVQWQVT